jgi:hypothetical protein
MSAAFTAGGAGLSGGGVLARNTINPTTTASIASSSTVAAATSVKVDAQDTSTIDATILALNVAAGTNAIAIGIASAENVAGGTITASTSGSTVTASSGDIDVLASAHQTLTTYSVLLSAAFGAIAGALTSINANERIEPNVTASVSGGTLTATGNDVNVHATFTGVADPTATALAAGV